MGFIEYENYVSFYKELCAPDKIITLQYRNSNKYIKTKINMQRHS